MIFITFSDHGKRYDSLSTIRFVFRHEVSGLHGPGPSTTVAYSGQNVIISQESSRDNANIDDPVPALPLAADFPFPLFLLYPSCFIFVSPLFVILRKFSSVSLPSFPLRKSSINNTAAFSKSSSPPFVRAVFSFSAIKTQCFRTDPRLSSIP